MLSGLFISLVAFATSPFFGIRPTAACNTHITEPPLFWLANLRNSTGTNTPIVDGPGLRKIRFDAGSAAIPVTEKEKYELEKTGIRFMDVTEDDLEAVYAELEAVGRLQKLASYPSAPTHQTAVKQVIASLSLDNMKSDMATLTAYNNRYYRSTTGAQSSNDLLTKLKSIASSAPGTGGAITVKQYTNTFTMASVIARIEGSTSGAPLVVIGAHLDSINQSNPTSGRAPGADDDGTGCVNLIEAFRKLVAAGFKPANPVEFHWYAGEEGGLLGSAAISKAYAKAGTQVRSMMQLDMTGYVKPGTSPVVGFMTDYTDSGLTTFAKTLVSTYMSNTGTTSSKCGYACSDHASWTSAGYPSVMPFETTFGDDNPNIHSANDLTTVSGFSWSHSFEFTKLAVAYVMELSLPAALAKKDNDGIDTPGTAFDNDTLDPSITIPGTVTRTTILPSETITRTTILPTDTVTRTTVVSSDTVTRTTVTPSETVTRTTITPTETITRSTVIPTSTVTRHCPWWWLDCPWA